MKFRTKQMLIFSLPIALLCCAFLVFLLGSYKNRIIEETEYRRSSIAIHLHNDIIDMVYAGDILQLTAAIENIQSSVSYIDYIFVIGDNGHLLAHTFGTSFPSELFNVNFLPADKSAASKLLMTNKERVRDFAIRIARHMPGEIHVGMNEEIFYKQISDFVKMTLIVTIICLFLGLLIVYAISGYLSKPLENLSLGMKKIEQGNLEYRLEEKGDRETLNLIRSYNRMTESILDSTTGLQQANEKIEKLNSLLYAIRNINQLITVEKDRNRMIQGACDNLVNARGLYFAWIVLLDESGASVMFAEAGFGEDFLLIKEMLNRGELPVCGQMALKQSDVLVVENLASTCTNCPLKDRYGDRRSMAVRLEHGGKVYGLLSVIIPKDLIMEKQERNLIKEISEDIALALYAIELEEKHKQTEKALRNSEERLAGAVDGNLIPTFLINNNHLITHWNKSCENLTGISAAEIVSTRKLWSAFYAEKRPVPADLIVDKASEEEIAKHYEGKCNKSILAEGAYEYEDFFPDMGKKGKWLFFTASPLKNFSGTVIGAIGTFQDVTEQRSIQEQLRQSQKMEAIGILAGGIAHDFNNLLTVIIGNAQLALMNVIENESLRKGIEETKKAGEKAASLTRQLLAFSRKQIIKPGVLDINIVVNETKKMLKRMIGEDIEFQTVLEPELRKVYVDSGQIDQIIMNLAVNAGDSMSQGGKLTIETANADLNENYFREHGIKETPGYYVMLAVSDTGCGMDEETREHIFEPFFTTKEVGRGTGLGLSTVYGIVKQSNGFVWVYSEPGRGSTFKVYLPEVKEDANPVKEKQTIMDDPGGSETILIVEDDSSLRNFAQRVLLSYGYRILNAENGEDALRVCKEHDGQIDLMITDVVMPKMGGRDAAKRLHPLYPQMKVVYMSGYTDNAIVHHGVLEPGLNFLEKPFTAKNLARKVREVLNENRI